MNRLTIRKVAIQKVTIRKVTIQKVAIRKVTIQGRINHLKFDRNMISFYDLTDTIVW